MRPQESKNNLDRMISAGFKPLTVKAGAQDRCIAAVLAAAISAKPVAAHQPRILMFPTVRPVYLAAAALAMTVATALTVSLTVFSNKQNHPQIAIESPRIQTPANDPAIPEVVSVVAAAAGEHKTVSLGLRTTALVQGASRMQVLKEDREATVVEVAQGTVTFNVTPGGSDQVTIWAGTVVYRVVGTLFTIERHNDETSLKVYRGTVSVDLAGFPASSVHAGQNWASRRPGCTGTFTSAKGEIDQLTRALGLPLTEPAAASTPRIQTTAPAVQPAVQDPIPDQIALEAALNQTRHHLFIGHMDSLCAYLSTITHNMTRDSIFKEIIRTAQQKVTSKQYASAEKLYKAVIDAWPGSSQTQDAYLSLLTILEQRNSRPGDRIDLIQTYLATYPAGTYAPELLQKQIQMLRKTGDLAACREAAHRFVVSFPDHPQAAELLYLSATLLRENLRQTEQALFEYRAYLSRYPGGKHAEDVMYWAIKLGEISPTIGQR